MNEQPTQPTGANGGDAAPMKLFRCPNGLQVWNAPESGAEVRFIYDEIFGRHCYERNGVSVRDGDVVVDVGANVGLFALSLMERFHGLKIMCVEPVPATRACLARNLAESPRRSHHDVLVVPRAVGSTPGETTIAYFPQAPGNSTMHLDAKRRDWARLVNETSFSQLWHMNKRLALLVLPLLPWRRRVFARFVEPVLDRAVTVPCQVCTVSDLIRQHELDRIDVLKIDVEGAELDVLDGIEAGHWPRIRQVAAEIAPMNKSALVDLDGRLKSLGFARVTIESVRGGAPVLRDASACALYAVRSPAPGAS